MMYDMLLQAVQSRPEPRLGRTLLISVNPDLKSDFGHYLNYEKRINELCSGAGVVHHCLSNVAFKSTLPYISPVFKHDSGHYCLHRGSAKGREAEFTAELHDLITDWITRNKAVEGFDQVLVFIYMSSTRSAAQLSCLTWPEKTRVVANAFWDFLSPLSKGEDPDLARIKLQDTVRLLAMSTTHQKLIFQNTGHRFASIPNPPPLVSDKVFADLLRVGFATKSTRATPQPTVFLPGLMTKGKGGDVTVDYVKGAEATFPTARFVLRDRLGEAGATLAGATGDRVDYITGDLTDAQVIDRYRAADIAILPYSAAVFEFRTSGALVDCLMSSTVPIVLPGTWLADMCLKYGFGIIAAGETVADLNAATTQAIATLKPEVDRMLGGALRYMQDNSWQSFLRTILPLTSAGQTVAPTTPELEQLRANFKSLSDFATDLEQRLAGSRPMALPPGNDLLDRLAQATDAGAARMLLTSVGSGLLLDHGSMAARLATSTTLRDAVDRALASLPEADPHKVQFLRVRQRARATA